MFPLGVNDRARVELTMSRLTGHINCPKNPEGVYPLLSEESRTKRGLLQLLCNAAMRICTATASSRSDRSNHDATGPRRGHLEAITEHNRSVLAVRVVGLG